MCKIQLQNAEKKYKEVVKKYAKKFWVRRKLAQTYNKINPKVYLFSSQETIV